MSWNDPCRDCGNPRYGCTCERETKPVVPEVPKTFSKEDRFKVMEEMFFTNTICVHENLTLEEARKHDGYTGDVYTSRYILPMSVPPKTLYDYPFRVSSIDKQEL